METLFDRLQMNDFRDVLGAKMSTGMKQKVSVARAVVHDPPVLIFDEATAGLDVLVARRCSRRSPNCGTRASASFFRPISCARRNGFATGFPSCTRARSWPKEHSTNSASGMRSGIWRSCSSN